MTPIRTVKRMETRFLSKRGDELGRPDDGEDEGAAPVMTGIDCEVPVADGTALMDP